MDSDAGWQPLPPIQLPAHVLAPWNELPAQIDAVTPDTRLVTITIGGNDLNYIGNLFMVGRCISVTHEALGTVRVMKTGGMIGEVVGKAKMDFALYEGREQIATQTRELMQKLMDLYRTGVNIQKVTLQSVQPPDTRSRGAQDGAAAAAAAGGAAAGREWSTSEACHTCRSAE